MNTLHMQLKTIVPVAAACFIGGWLVASLVAPPVAELQVLPDRAQPRSAASDVQHLAPYTERLHLKLQRAPVAPVPRRNPFVFGERLRTVLPAPTRVEVPDQPTGPVEPIVTGPSLTLSGIGESEMPDGIIRTAVISDGRTVHLAKTGDVVNGYAVVEITENSVVVGDAAGARWTLRFR
jgi:hypothetical protein